MPQHPPTLPRRTVRLAPIILVLGLTPGLGGCVAALGAGTIAATDKTPVDHAYSLITGKDCSQVRLDRGLTYCAEDEVTPAINVHCYPTLGEVTCYDRTDPFPGGQREVGSHAAARAPAAASLR